jgi:tetratricopeptide (TPR) repeat protein
MRRQPHLFLGLALASTQIGCFSVINEFGLTPDAPLESSEKNKDASLPEREQADVCAAVGADLQKAGHFADAIVQFEQARKLNPRKYKNLSRRLAVLYDRIGEERKALDEFAEAVKRSPKDADLINDLGYCHYNRARWAEAEKYFRQATALQPKHQRATINLGLALAQQGKRDEAIRVFETVLRPAEAKANLAFVLATQGQRDEAMELYRAALQLEPGLSMAHHALASLEKGPPKKEEFDIKPVDARAKTPTKPIAKIADEPEPLPDQSPFIVDPKTIGKSK